MVAIARALDISAKILILDEPTSSLDKSEVKQLFNVINGLKEQGIGIIFITHFFDQVYQITDRITILRNGKLVGSYDTKDLSKVQLIAHMLGKELAEFEFSEEESSKEGHTVDDYNTFLEIRNMERIGEISEFDLKICNGEVLGLAGLLGSGRTEIAKLLFGVSRPHKGEAFINNKKVNISSPRKAIKHRFAFCPEDRREEGIISDLTVRENIILAVQARKGIFNQLSKKEQDNIVDKYIKELSIVTPSAEQRVKNLSGGNQQKVILARWLASDPVFLILDEPTRGIDVGVKADIQKIILSLSRDGMAILFISSELEEVIRCSDRVVIMRDRKKIDEITGDNIKEDVIMHTIANKEES